MRKEIETFDKSCAVCLGIDNGLSILVALVGLDNRTGNRIGRLWVRRRTLRTRLKCLVTRTGQVSPFYLREIAKNGTYRVNIATKRMQKNRGYYTPGLVLKTFGSQGRWKEKIPKLSGCHNIQLHSSLRLRGFGPVMVLQSCTIPTNLP